MHWFPDPIILPKMFLPLGETFVVKMMGWCILRLLAIWHILVLCIVLWCPPHCLNLARVGYTIHLKKEIFRYIWQHESKWRLPKKETKKERKSECYITGRPIWTQKSEYFIMNWKIVGEVKLGQYPGMKRSQIELNLN